MLCSSRGVTTPGLVADFYEEMMSVECEDVDIVRYDAV